MKKIIWIVALVFAALAVFGIGVAFAQDVTPPHNGGGKMGGSQGMLEPYMAAEFAEILDLNVNDINSRLAAGETMYDIALSVGVKDEDFPALVTEVRVSALAAAVDMNVITREQADWMTSRGYGQESMENGTCTGSGPVEQGASFEPQSGRGHGMGGWRTQPTTP